MIAENDIVTVTTTPIGVARALELVVEKLNAIKKENDAMQALVAPGSRSWHRYETIDDRVHEALQLLGE
jgi:hypothetical protein